MVVGSYGPESLHVSTTKGVTEREIGGQRVAGAETSADVADAEPVLDGDGVFEAPALLRILWADPQHMPEHLALWSLKRFGRRAAAAVETLRAAHPDTEARQLEALAIEHQTRVSMTEGAFVGGPFIFLIPVAFCAALLAQAQMALELAAINGYAPNDQMRAADLLVIQGAYSSTDEASAALAKVTRDPRRHEGKKLPRGSRWGMVKRMAYILGLLGASGTQKPSRLRSLFQYALLGTVFLVGLVLPLVWVPYMAWAFRKSGLQMGTRASEFYGQRRTAETGVTVTAAPSVQVAMSAGLARMALLLMLPVVVGLIAFFTGTDIGSGKLFSAVILLIAASALATLGWFAYRKWRRHHQSKRVGEPARQTRGVRRVTGS